MPSKGLVLLSGGMDSTTLLAKVIDELGEENVSAVSYNYGALHGERENQAARDVAEWYGLPLEEIELPKIFAGGHSALMGDADTPMPELTYEQILTGEGPSPTVVPFRNANLLSLAVTVAITKECDLVYAAMHATDAGGFAYPDCTPEFLGAFAACVYIGSYHKVHFRFPFIWTAKEDLVGLAAELSAPLHLSWSCYRPIVAGESITHWYAQCGTCPTCVERIAAFKKWGFADVVPYAIPIEWQPAAHGRVLKWPTA